jgi:hypothetical protein
MGNLNWAKRAYALFLLCATTATAMPPQTFTTPQSGSITAVVPVYGQQENSAYNGHFESTCYHPLLLFNLQIASGAGTQSCIGRRSGVPF